MPKLQPLETDSSIRTSGTQLARTNSQESGIESFMNTCTGMYSLSLRIDSRYKIYLTYQI